MTLDELHRRATEAATTGNGFLTLILPAKRPAGFPRGELMCVNGSDKVFSVNASRVLKWLDANGFSSSENET